MCFTFNLLRLQRIVATCLIGSNLPVTFIHLFRFSLRSALIITTFSKLHPWELFCHFCHVGVWPKSQVLLNDGILTFQGHLYKILLKFRVTSALSIARFLNCSRKSHFAVFRHIGVHSKSQVLLNDGISTFREHFLIKIAVQGNKCPQNCKIL